MRLTLLLPLLLAAVAEDVRTQPCSGPIIDVDLHAGQAVPGAPNPTTGQLTSASTDEDRERLAL